ncbi:MAG TPA: ABC transporter permease, partial [Acidimicrobiales bacterium]|nr:ABC transporter permease [Acidimicrobiales bacterium]
MLQYTARRLASAVLVALGVTLATFLLMHLEPGDPARAVLGLRATPGAVEALRSQWGLNSSLPHQLGHFLWHLFQGNLGESYIYRVPVSSLIYGHIGQTAALVAMASLFAVVITVPLAAWASSHKDGIGDHLVRALSVFGLALPAFWFGIVLIEIFAVHLHVLPVGGTGTGLGGYLESLVLPALTASFAIAPILVRSLRVGMIEVFDAEFVAVARAKGLSERRVVFAHVVRNALVPTVTLLG